MALSYPLQMPLDGNFDTSKTAICKYSRRIVRHWARWMDDSMADGRRGRRKKRTREIQVDNEMEKKAIFFYYDMTFSHSDKRLIFFPSIERLFFHSFDRRECPKHFGIFFSNFSCSSFFDKSNDGKNKLPYRCLANIRIIWHTNKWGETIARLDRLKIDP